MLPSYAFYAPPPRLLHEGYSVFVAFDYAMFYYLFMFGERSPILLKRELMTLTFLCFVRNVALDYSEWGTLRHLERVPSISYLSGCVHVLCKDE